MLPLLWSTSPCCSTHSDLAHTHTHERKTEWEVRWREVVKDKLPLSLALHNFILMKLVPTHISIVKRPHCWQNIQVLNFKHLPCLGHYKENQFKFNVYITQHHLHKTTDNNLEFKRCESRGWGVPVGRSGELKDVEGPTICNTQMYNTYDTNSIKRNVLAPFICMNCNGWLWHFGGSRRSTQQNENLQ